MGRMAILDIRTRPRTSNPRDIAQREAAGESATYGMDLNVNGSNLPEAKTDIANKLGDL